MLWRLTVPAAIAAAVVGAVFTAVGVFEVHVCFEYMSIIGADTIQTNDTITYLADQCLPAFGIGSLHFLGAFILWRVHDADIYGGDR